MLFDETLETLRRLASNPAIVGAYCVSLLIAIAAARYGE
jgi:hypothetical protein